MKDNVKPVISTKSLGGFVSVRGESDFAGVRAAFDFDEADFDGSLRVFGVRFARHEVKAAILRLHTLDFAAAPFLLSDDVLNGGAFNQLEMHPRDGQYEPLVGYIVLEQSQAAVDMLGRRLVHLKTRI